MQFSISSAELKEQLQIVNGAIGSNPVLPILEDFLFNIEENKLSIAATDLETFMTSKLDVQASAAGSIAIPAKILLDTLKQLPAQPLKFDIDTETFAVSITSQFGQYNLAGENGEDFPKLPVVDAANTIEIPAAVLLEGINKTLFATSNDELRPAMTGVFVQINNEGLTFVATDAHKLVKYVFSDLEVAVEGAFILPKKALNLLKNALSNSSENVKISFNGTNAFFHFGEQVLVCRLIDARYPDYNAVIPTNNPNILSITRSDL